MKKFKILANKFKNIEEIQDPGKKKFQDLGTKASRVSRNPKTKQEMKKSKILANKFKFIEEIQDRGKKKFQDLGTKASRVCKKSKI